MIQKSNDSRSVLYYAFILMVYGILSVIFLFVKCLPNFSFNCGDGSCMVSFLFDVATFLSIIFIGIFFTGSAIVLQIYRDRRSVEYRMEKLQKVVRWTVIPFILFTFFMVFVIVTVVVSL